MCGIFGFWLNRPLNVKDLNIGRNCTSELIHRGPDGFGEWYDLNKGIYFGHRRLAINDLNNRSNQPMIRNNTVLSFNGEIYNFIELKKELEEKGNYFETTGDTEVLLKSWIHWEEEIFEKIDAMFSLAIKHNNQLVLATDAFGEKPLYVANTDEGTWFSSEPQPLIKNLNLKWDLSEEELKLFLSLGYLPPPKTGFRNLEIISPATFRTYDSPIKFKDKCYWQLSSNLNRKDKIKKIEQKHIDHIHDIIIQSVEHRLRADVPLGIFLSSGVDSALIAAIAKKELKKNVTAFTVSFKEGLDESINAKSVANHLKIPHIIVQDKIKNETDYQSNLSKNLINLYGVPNDNVTGLSIKKMTDLAKDHFKVCLSGSGGDELAYGYNKYLFLWEKRFFYRLPKSIINFLKIVNPLFLNFHSFKLLQKYILGDKNYQYISLKNGGLISNLNEMLNKLPKFAFNNNDLYIQARDIDIKWTLPRSYLTSIDAGSMQNSIEVRSPLLNKKLFSAMNEIEDNLFLLGGQKHFLKKILSKYLPQKLINQNKIGFTSPISKFITSLSKPPSPKGIPVKSIDNLWNNKRNESAKWLILRLKILEDLYNNFE